MVAGHTCCWEGHLYFLLKMGVITLVAILNMPAHFASLLLIPKWAAHRTEGYVQVSRHVRWTQNEVKQGSSGDRPNRQRLSMDWQPTHWSMYGQWQYQAVYIVTYFVLFVYAMHCTCTLYSLIMLVNWYALTPHCQYYYMLRWRVKNYEY